MASTASRRTLAHRLLPEQLLGVGDRDRWGLAAVFVCTAAVALVLLTAVLVTATRTARLVLALAGVTCRAGGVSIAARHGVAQLLRSGVPQRLGAVAVLTRPHVHSGRSRSRSTSSTG